MQRLTGLQKNQANAALLWLLQAAANIDDRRDAGRHFVQSLHIAVDSLARINQVASGHGGRRPGAGRRFGSRNRATIERELMAQKGLEYAMRHEGRLPLDALLAVMNGDTTITSEMFLAAVAAAPYIHPRLASTNATVRSDDVVRIVSDQPLRTEEWLEKFATPANGVEAFALPCWRMSWTR